MAAPEFQRKICKSCNAYRHGGILLKWLSQALEKELGIELIHRQNRRFTLTVAGEYFYAHSKGILEQTEELIRGVRRLGTDQELHLRIGYPRSYSGLELHQAVSEFSGLYPEVSISIVNGTHEELYELLCQENVDVILNDQRRAFSETYVNKELIQCVCCAEVSVHSSLGKREFVTMEELRRLPCILISSKEQQSEEQEYYQNTLDFGGSYLFAENLEEGRLLVASNRGFLPVEQAGTLPAESPSIRRLPIYKDGKPFLRNYCMFWKKDRSNYYMEEFAEILHWLLEKSIGRMSGGNCGCN